MYVRHFGFTVVELLMVIAMIAVISAISVPAFRSYQLHNDVVTASEQVMQALARAKLLAQSGKNGSAWGFSSVNSVIFQGNSYGTRVVASDEQYPLPAGIVVTGMTEVTFAQLSGVPSAVGSIILTSKIDPSQQVTVIVSAAGVGLSGSANNLTICFCGASPERTISIPNSEWPAHQENGDYLGACHEETNPICP